MYKHIAYNKNGEVVGIYNSHRQYTVANPKSDWDITICNGITEELLSSGKIHSEKIVKLHHPKIGGCDCKEVVIVYDYNNDGKLSCATIIVVPTWFINCE